MTLMTPGILLGHNGRSKWIEVGSQMRLIYWFTVILVSMGWLKWKSTGNHRFSHEIWDCPVLFPLNLNQSINGWWYTYPSEKYESVGMIIPNRWENREYSKPQTRIDKSWFHSGSMMGPWQSWHVCACYFRMTRQCMFFWGVHGGTLLQSTWQL